MRFVGLSQNHHSCVHYVFELSSDPWNVAFFYCLTICQGRSGLELLLGLSYFNTLRLIGQRTNLRVLPPTKNVHSSFSFRNQENDLPDGPPVNHTRARTPDINGNPDL